VPKPIIIDDGWSEPPGYSTGGTRAKRFLLAPDGRKFFFKRSQFKLTQNNTIGTDFKYEFWSEIIASRLGHMVGFDVLQYEAAIDGDKMGCISELMIDRQREELIEGVQYLKRFSPNYDPNIRSHKAWYTFDLIINALENAGFKKFGDDILEMIVFDSLIGNGDRHQENWAIIAEKILPSVRLSKEIESGKRKPNRIFQEMLDVLKKLEQRLQTPINKLPPSYYEIDYRFAPIYDNGSSLGRELTDQRVEELLGSDAKLKTYIEAGKSEIHWDGRKLGHFDLIRKLMATIHKEKVVKIIKRVIQNFDAPKLNDIIRDVDEEVPDVFEGFKIPAIRKQIIYKIIKLRFELLQDLVNDRI
jgi:hypothetical protein